MPMSGGFWDLVNKQGDSTPTASPYGQPGAPSNPASAPQLVGGPPKDVAVLLDNFLGRSTQKYFGTEQQAASAQAADDKKLNGWFASAPLQDLYQTSLDNFLSGNRQGAYDVMQKLMTLRGKELVNSPLSQQVQRLDKRLRVELNLP